MVWLMVVVPVQWSRCRDDQSCVGRGIRLHVSCKQYSCNPAPSCCIRNNECGLCGCGDQCPYRTCRVQHHPVRRLLARVVQIQHSTLSNQHETRSAQTTMGLAWCNLERHGRSTHATVTLAKRTQSKLRHHNAYCAYNKAIIIVVGAQDHIQTHTQNPATLPALPGQAAAMRHGLHHTVRGAGGLAKAHHISWVELSGQTWHQGHPELCGSHMGAVLLWDTYHDHTQEKTQHSAPSAIPDHTLTPAQQHHHLHTHLRWCHVHC